MPDKAASPPMASFDPDSDAFVDVLDQDAIPAIDDPRFDDDPDLDDDEPVVGVALDGEARAYPVRILDWHEIVNDAIAGTPIVVTYCPLCGTGLAFDRRVDDRTLTFGVSGNLYKNDLVLYDRQTGTLWSQLPGEAFHGELDGTRLTPVATDLTTWGEWRKTHPDAEALVPPKRPGAYGDQAIRYDRDPHTGYHDDHDDIRFPVERLDDRLPAKTRVAGLPGETPPIAYPRAKLPDEGTLRDDDRLIVQLSGRIRAYRVDRDWRLVGDDLVDEAGNRVDAATGIGDVDLRPLDVRHAFWFTWADFFPETQIGPAASGPDANS